MRASSRLRHNFSHRVGERTLLGATSFALKRLRRWFLSGSAHRTIAVAGSVTSRPKRRVGNKCRIALPQLVEVVCDTNAFLNVNITPLSRQRYTNSNLQCYTESQSASGFSTIIREAPR